MIFFWLMKEFMSRWFHSPPRPCEVHKDNQRKWKTPKPQCFICSLIPNTCTKRPCLPTLGSWKIAIHAKVQKFQPSLPVLEIEGCKQALKAPLAAFFLHFPSERCTKDWLCTFAQVGELRNKQIWVFLIFSQNVLGNWWPSFNLSLKWNISAITTQSHSKNFKLGSSKACQDFKLQCITSCQGRSKRREGYRRGQEKRVCKTRSDRKQK